VYAVLHFLIQHLLSICIFMVSMDYGRLDPSKLSPEKHLEIAGVDLYSPGALIESNVNPLNSFCILFL